MATIDLDAIQVAKPCSADWSAMEGDEQVRFCGVCRQNVYDLSALTADEARALIEKNEGRLCVRFFRRRDGRMLTRDCPVGVSAVRRRRAGIAAGIAAAAGLAGGLVSGLRGRPLPVVGASATGGTQPLVVFQATGTEPSTGTEPPTGTEVPPDLEPEIMGEMEMGDAVLPETKGKVRLPDDDRQAVMGGLRAPDPRGE